MDDDSDDDFEEITQSAFFKCPEDLEGWEIETWSKEQEKEAKTNKQMALIFAKAKDPSQSRFKLLSSGLLVKVHTQAENAKEGVREKVVVPESLKAFVIGQHHNLELHGHQGRKRTQSMIEARYYWPNMTSDIRRWIKACSGCSKRKMTRPLSSGLVDINQASRPWQTVGIDIVGELPLTKKCNKWILTMVDHFSKWPIAVPIPDRESSTIASSIFENLITVHGPPETILSDQGAELISKGIEKLCSRWGIRKVNTGGYNPTGNANCERFHRYLNSAMTILRDKDAPTDWDEYLQAVLFSYRVSVNDATGYSPYYLLNGRSPTIPSDLSFNVLDEEYKDKEQYVAKMTERLKKAFDEARKRQYAAAVDNQERGKEKYKPDFKPGDMLFVWARSSEEARMENADGKRVSLPKKWINPWIGPFRMIRWTSERKCLLDMGGGKEKEFIVNRLAKHNRWDEVNPSTYAWSLKEKAKSKELLQEIKVADAALEISQKFEVFDNEYVFQEGEIIVFEQEPTKEYAIPFGLGTVMKHVKGEPIQFQWRGNRNNNERGRWDLCWYQQNEQKIYYSAKPIHHSHERNTGDATDTKIKVGDVIMSSRGDVEILHSDKARDASYLTLTSQAKKIIEANAYVVDGRKKLQRWATKSAENLSKGDHGKSKKPKIA